jgi:hypothetical protein
VTHLGSISPDQLDMARMEGYVLCWIAVLRGIGEWFGRRPWHHEPIEGNVCSDRLLFVRMAS